MTQAHESSLRVLIWNFLSCYIRHSFTIPKGLLSVLYSNGLARYPSPWHCPWPWYLPSRICLRTRLVLVLQTPLFRGSPWSYGRKDKCGTFSRVLSWVGCFSGGVVVVSLALLICPLGHCPTNICSLLSRIPYSTWPSLPLYIREFLGATVERSKCGTFPRVLSSRWGVKTGPECRGRALPSRHFWWHRVLFTDTLSFLRFSSRVTRNYGRGV